VNPLSETGPRSRGRLALDRGGASRERGCPAPERGRLPLEGHPTLERDGTSLEGGDRPTSEADLYWVALYPSSGAEFRPRVAGPIVRRAVRPWVCLCVCLGSFLFIFYEFKRVSPGCLGDPYDCPRQ
jgi:hypothetical protein